MKKILTAHVFCIMMSSAALAHEPRPGPNGGLKVDAGDYHVELVANGTDTVTLFLFDVNDQPVDSAGFKANAILIVNGKPARFAIEPTTGQQLAGKAPGIVEPGVKGAIQIVLPDGATAQAKF
jgi:hypothetical protein